MFERFTEEARRALTVAQDEAKALNHDFIGTEHLLLGLLATSSQGMTVDDALTELGVSLDDARAKVAELVHPARNIAPGTPPFTPLAKKALERSLRAALTLNDSYIAPHHMLLGLIDVSDGGGAQVLADLAGSLEHSRQVVLAHIGKSPTAAPKREVSGSRRARLWITRGGTSDPAGTGDSGPAVPRCANCKAPLIESARYQSVGVPVADDDAGDRVPVTVTVVYCGNCGTAVGIA